jgi:hypothetical protein
MDAEIDRIKKFKKHETYNIAIKIKYTYEKSIGHDILASRKHIICKQSTVLVLINILDDIPLNIKQMQHYR